MHIICNKVLFVKTHSSPTSLGLLIFLAWVLTAIAWLQILVQILGWISGWID